MKSNNKTNLCYIILSYRTQQTAKFQIWKLSHTFTSLGKGRMLGSCETSLPQWSTIVKDVAHKRHHQALSSAFCGMRAEGGMLGNDIQITDKYQIKILLLIGTSNH